MSSAGVVFLKRVFEKTFDADNAAGSTFTEISFDDLGRPILDTGNCNITGCKITVGEVAICVSGEGAIYGC